MGTDSITIYGQNNAEINDFGIKINVILQNILLYYYCIKEKCRLIIQQLMVF